MKLKTKVIARTIFKKLVEKNFEVFSDHRSEIENTVHDVIQEFAIAEDKEETILDVKCNSCKQSAIVVAVQERTDETLVEYICIYCRCTGTYYKREGQKPEQWQALAFHTDSIDYLEMTSRINRVLKALK